MRFICILITAFLLLSCNNKNQKPINLEHLKFLTGVWENHTPAGIVYEEWDRKSDSVMTGKSYAVNSSDTLYFERIVIRIKDKDIYFIPSVIEQNDGKPILFKLIANSTDTLIFENKEHDFPQRIIYINKGKDSLYARIKKTEKGVSKSEEFRMRRFQKQN